MQNMAKISTKSALSLPYQIKEDIRKKMLSGKLKPEERLLSEQKLALEYGVSRITTRQALSELTGEGFLYRIPGKGTFVAGRNELNKNACAASNLIMVIVPELKCPFYYQVIRGIERQTAGNGFEMILRSANEEPADERACLQKALAYAIRGVVLVASKYSCANLEIIREISQRMPVVVVDVAIAGLKVDFVCSDDRKGAHLVTKHLIELGHTKILHLAGPAGDSSAEERVRGYRDALDEQHLEFNAEDIRFTEWNSESGYYETKKYYLNGQKEEKAKAIFACNDMVALGAFRALGELGLKVPEEVALAGYCNMEAGNYMDVPLTTVDQFAFEMGKEAVALLMEKLTGKRNLEETKEVRMPTKLVIRKSCGIQK